MKLDISGLRKKLHLSQKELADRLGIRQSFLSAIETGKSPLPADKLRRLAEICAPEPIDNYFIVPAAEKDPHTAIHQHAGEGVNETSMLKDLLNYFHTQAHRDQDEHHEMMHAQINTYQERNDKLQQRNDLLQEKVEQLNNTIEELRTELHNVRTDNLRLKEILLNNHIKF